MEHVAVEDIENHPRVATVTKGLTGPLGLDAMALNYYELEPGDSFSGGVHSHTNQEEAFYVLEGVATFETLDDEREVVAGEAIRFAAGEYQEGRNESDGRVRALAFGAPQESGEVHVPIGCRACGEADHLVSHVHDDGGITLECPECGNAFDV